MKRGTPGGSNVGAGPPSLAKNYNTLEASVSGNYKKSLRTANEEIKRLKAELENKNKEMDKLKQGFMDWYSEQIDPNATPTVQGVQSNPA